MTENVDNIIFENFNFIFRFKFSMLEKRNFYNSIHSFKAIYFIKIRFNPGIGSQNKLKLKRKY